MMMGKCEIVRLNCSIRNLNLCIANCRDDFGDSDDEGSISLDEDDGSDGSDIFDSDFDENESDPDVSDPDDDDEPKSKRMKPVSNKDFQKKLKHTSSKCFVGFMYG